MNSGADIDALLAIMARLRDPERGCAWDRRQDAHSLAPYTLEEAYEVVDAIARGDGDGLRDELGDLLLQVVFHARIAQEQGGFDFAAVVRGLADKLVRRHPHVFAGETAQDDAARSAQWEAHKAQERATRSADTSVMADVPRALPALTRAQKLQRRAAILGLDWPDPQGVLDKLQEEFSELAQARLEGAPASVEAELGDVLFTVVNLSRHLRVDAESALRGASRRFEARVRALEQALAQQGLSAGDCDAAQLDQFWCAIKATAGDGAADGPTHEAGRVVPSAPEAGPRYPGNNNG